MVSKAWHGMAWHGMADLQKAVSCIACSHKVAQAVIEGGICLTSVMYDGIAYSS